MITSVGGRTPAPSPLTPAFAGIDSLCRRKQNHLHWRGDLYRTMAR